MSINFRMSISMHNHLAQPAFSFMRLMKQMHKYCKELTNKILLFKKQYNTAFRAKEPIAIKNHQNNSLILCQSKTLFEGTFMK